MEGKNAPELVLEKPLDWEQQSSYLLVLTAVDGGDWSILTPFKPGSKSLMPSITLQCSIRMCTKLAFERSCPQAPVCSRWLILTGWDHDMTGWDNDNAEITYSFKTLRDNGNMNMQDDQSGEVKLKDPIDFEISSSYTMSIESKDGGDMATGNFKREWQCRGGSFHFCVWFHYRGWSTGWWLLCSKHMITIWEKMGKSYAL